MLKLNAEIDALKGVGPALKTKLNNRGVRSIEDILFLLPNRLHIWTDLYIFSLYEAGLCSYLRSILF